MSYKVEMRVIKITHTTSFTNYKNHSYGFNRTVKFLNSMIIYGIYLIVTLIFFFDLFFF
jgi:hypothetical protein